MRHQVDVLSLGIDCCRHQMQCRPDLPGDGVICLLARAGALARQVWQTRCAHHGWPCHARSQLACLCRSVSQACSWASASQRHATHSACCSAAAHLHADADHSFIVQAMDIRGRDSCRTLRFCSTSACTLPVLWQYFQIS